LRVGGGVFMKRGEREASKAANGPHLNPSAGRFL
jgi:hypothetical protein